MIKKIAAWAKQAVLGLAMCLSVAPVAMAQAPYSSSTNTLYAPVVFTATSQTSAAIQFGGPSGAGSSYAVGNISVTGVALTTATITVLGSTDGGVTYTALNVSPINSPSTVATTTTVVAAGVYQVNLGGITNVKFSTSGTFTATSISIVLTASPNGVIARAGAAGSANVNVANTFTQAQTAPAFYPSTVTSGPYVDVFEDFTGSTVNWNPGSIGSPTGNNWGTTTIGNTTNNLGIAIITSGTGGTGTGEYSRYGTQYFIDSPNSAAPVWTMEFMAQPAQLPSVTTGAVQVGMTDTFPPTSPNVTGVGFILSSGDGVVNDWYCQNSATLTDSTVAATLSWTRLTMKNDGTNLRYYINGVEATACRVAIASAPSAAQEPIVTASALSASSVALYIDYFTFLDNVVR